MGKNHRICGSLTIPYHMHGTNCRQMKVPRATPSSRSLPRLQAHAPFFVTMHAIASTRVSCHFGSLFPSPPFPVSAGSFANDALPGANYGKADKNHWLRMAWEMRETAGVLSTHRNHTIPTPNSKPRHQHEYPKTRLQNPKPQPPTPNPEPSTPNRRASDTGDAEQA